MRDVSVRRSLSDVLGNGLGEHVQYRREDHAGLLFESQFQAPSRLANRHAFVSLRLARGPVLDVGCGGGFQVEAFRRFGMRPTGLDISVNSIAFARNAFSKCDFHCENFK